MASADRAGTAPLALAVTTTEAAVAFSDDGQVARSGHTASVLDGHILLFGGRDSDGTCLSSVEAIPVTAVTEVCCCRRNAHGRFIGQTGSIVLGDQA
eukprot:6194476-Pleurochrysis_carterae.AAC.2